MRLQEKLTLYNAITKVVIILVLGLIILLSIDKIAYQHSDSRLVKKYKKLTKNLSFKEIDSLLKQDKSFTDYNVLKDEFIVLQTIKTKPNEALIDTTERFFTDEREINGSTEFYRILNKNFQYKNENYNLELGINMTSTNAIKTTLRLYMFIVLIVALFITLLTDIIFYKILLKPFYKIIDKKLNQVNHPNNFDYTFTPTNTTDFRILDTSINQLMYKINNLFHLEKEFIANVSHELLTPISLLNNRLENLLSFGNLNIEQEEKISSSLKTLAKLKSIIKSLLLISKIENEQFVKDETIKIQPEINDILEDLKELLEEKNIQLEVILNYSLTNFKGNQSLISILFNNLILNAIKYNRINGFIKIRDNIINNNYIFIIEDNGIGMNKDFVNKSTERFKRGSNNGYEGFGLGLSIVKSIAKYHQLEIEINSEENLGSTILIYFPIK